MAPYSPGRKVSVLRPGLYRHRAEILDLYRLKTRNKVLFDTFSFKKKYEYSNLLFWRLHPPQGIGAGRNAECLVVDMGVNFGRIQVLMPQYLLDRLDVHAVLEHEGGGGVAELVGGILGAVQPGVGEMLFYQGVDVGTADPLVARGANGKSANISGG